MQGQRTVVSPTVHEALGGEEACMVAAARDLCCACHDIRGGGRESGHQGPVTQLALRVVAAVQDGEEGGGGENIRVAGCPRTMRIHTRSTVTATRRHAAVHTQNEPGLPVTLEHTEERKRTPSSARLCCWP